MAPANSGGPTMQKGGMSQEKVEPIKASTSTPGNMNNAPAPTGGDNGGGGNDENAPQQ